MAEKAESKLSQSLRLIASIFSGKGPFGGFSGSANEKIKKAGRSAANPNVRKRFTPKPK